jgi:hypothetical protein
LLEDIVLRGNAGEASCKLDLILAETRAMHLQNKEEEYDLEEL